MGVFGAIGAIRAVERLKTGRSQAETMSIADIAMISVNMSDAYKNLPRDQYREVQVLFDELQKEKEKKTYSLDEYMDEWTKIIFLFDSIAPIEQYCGNSDISANINKMKQDPSFYEMRDVVLKNPDFLEYARLFEKNEEELEEISEELEDGEESDNEEYDDETTENYEYMESYVIFLEENTISDAFDAELDVDICLYDDSDCLITIDSDSYWGTWKHDRSNLLDFSGFENSDKVVLRGLSNYMVKYADEEVYVYEDVPQIAGIRLKHVFSKY